MMKEVSKLVLLAVLLVGVQPAWALFEKGAEFEGVVVVQAGQEGGGVVDARDTDPKGDGSEALLTKMEALGFELRNATWSGLQADDLDSSRTRAGFCVGPCGRQGNEGDDGQEGGGESWRSFKRQKVKVIGAENRAYLGKAMREFARPIGQIYCERGDKALTSTATLVDNQWAVLTSGHYFEDELNGNHYDKESCIFRIFHFGEIIFSTTFKEVLNDFEPGSYYRDPKDKAVLVLDTQAPRDIVPFELEVSTNKDCKDTFMVAHHHVPEHNDRTTKYFSPGANAPVTPLGNNVFNHLMDTNGWASGGPIFCASDKKLIGIHIASEPDPVEANVGLFITQDILDAAKEAKSMRE